MRLIDADVLKKAVEDFPNCYNGWSDAYDKAYIIEAIEEAPTIEPKRGEWKNYKDEHYCTNCGEVVIGDWYDEADWYDFCPNCGADMRERKESE